MTIQIAPQGDAISESTLLYHNSKCHFGGSKSLSGWNYGKALMPCSVARNRSICCATLKAFSRSLGCSLSVTDRRGWGEREKKNWVSDTMRLVLSSSPQTFIKTYACDTTKMINTWKKIHTQTSQSASSSPNSLSYIFCHMERWRQMEADGAYSLMTGQQCWGNQWRPRRRV